MIHSEPRPLTNVEIQVLARYNAEVSRGISHTSDYQLRMAELQRRFDARMAWLDIEIARQDAEIELLKAAALPRWFVLTLLAVTVVAAAVAVLRGV